MSSSDNIFSSKWKRFRRNPRAFWSLIILSGLYIISLFANLICTEKPLWIKADGKSYFPLISHVSEDTLFGNGITSEPEFSKLKTHTLFASNSANRILFAPYRYGPQKVVSPEDFQDYRRLKISIEPHIKVGRCNLLQDFTIARPVACDLFLDESQNNNLTNIWQTTPEFLVAISNRFNNIESPRFSGILQGHGTNAPIRVSMLKYRPRGQAPKSLRLRIAPDESGTKYSPIFITVSRDKVANATQLTSRTKEEFKTILELVEKLDGETTSATATLVNETKITVELEHVSWPFRPTPNHWMGIDNAGRDVFARILFGLRTAMTFGLLLVGWSMLLGILIGSLQGYFGGWVDLSTQRAIEIWSALPFLYIMILIGSILGQSFCLLLFCYGLFNWIGVSYYVRAEFLRLRKRPFVEAAKCQGLSSMRIIWHHILPNALTPLVTLMPFNLVGAIASISALDFLGYGLPPLTPSWGELLQQAQQNSAAWWLILYPATILFLVMLLSVFIGEGLRDAYDPKPKSRYK